MNSNNERKKRILVVDDEPSVTRQIKRNLEATDQFVVQEENLAIRAMETARAFEPDVILMDVMMPEMDGGALAAEFQASPTLGRIPIVFLTAAVTQDEVSAHHGRIGGLPFLAKPVSTRELTDCLRQHIGD